MPKYGEFDLDVQNLKLEEPNLINGPGPTTDPEVSCGGTNTCYTSGTILHGSCC